MILWLPGHYARTGYDEKSGPLSVAKKRRTLPKTRAMSLYSLTQDQLSHVQFPLGELTKQEVRQIAREHGFLTADKAESQDICFVQDGKYYEFYLRLYRPGIIRQGILLIPGEMSWGVTRGSSATRWGSEKGWGSPLASRCM